MCFRASKFLSLNDWIIKQNLFENYLCLEVNNCVSSIGCKGCKCLNLFLEVFFLPYVADNCIKLLLSTSVASL